MDQILVYITAPDLDCARIIGRALVEQRLAACVNILPGMESLYWWNDALQSETEVVLLAKSTRILFQTLQDKVQSLHPYEVPCIVALDIVAGHAPFLSWIAAQVGKE